MAKSAERMAREVKVLYAESKARNPTAPESVIILRMGFDDDAMQRIPESSRVRIKACCETVQGFLLHGRLDFW